MAFYSRAHYARVSPRADTAADIQDRMIRSLALDRAKADREERFTVLTGDNAQAALDYQEQRFQFWMRGLFLEKGNVTS